MPMKRLMACSGAGEPYFRLCAEFGETRLALGDASFKVESNLHEPGTVLTIVLPVVVLEAIAKAYAPRCKCLRRNCKKI